MFLFDPESWKELIPGYHRRQMEEARLLNIMEDLELAGYQFDPPFAEAYTCQLMLLT